MKKLICLLFVWMTTLVSASEASADSRPNTLFAIADDMGHASAYGTPWVHTPNFDQLAERGHPISQRIHSERQMLAFTCLYPDRAQSVAEWSRGESWAFGELTFSHNDSQLQAVFRLIDENGKELETISLKKGA